MAGAHERRVARLDRILSDTLALETGLQIGELDLLADIEHASLQTLHIEEEAAGEERRRILHAELLQPVGRPHVGEAVAVVEEHVGLVALGPAHAAKMPERVHLRADLADLRRDELVVPDRAALGSP